MKVHGMAPTMQLNYIYISELENKNYEYINPNTEN
jgi:hypothetical protein